MYKYIIDGGFPLSGTIRASGNKNAALPCIAATLLTDEEVILRNVPEIEDVHVMAEILRSIGAAAAPESPPSPGTESTGVWRFCAQGLATSSISPEMASKIRASILFAGPLLARTGSVTLPPPGGDVIGRRRLDTHFLALEGLGAQVKTEGAFILQSNKLVGEELFLDEASVTATENAIMAAVTAEGETVIENAASEPHVQDLCHLLNAMGGQISGIGSNILRITGVPRLHGADYTLGADFMEVGSFIGLAAVTHSDITISQVNPKQLRMIRLAFAKLGIRWDTQGTDLHVPARQALRVVPDLGGMIPKIDDSPWPGFPPDLTSIMTVVATQVDGTVLIHEKMFESRMFFVDKLIGMGARIVLCDPHRAVVSGPARLSGSTLTSPDVRAGMAMVIAALCAEGKSVIRNVYQIERGYEHLTRRLRALGARIERVTVAD
ncbi:UDP-N-acetylglucosamine 1-carboxyvinyltransferase [Alkalispirochaeta sphaeroplastigenens]|uniref:UDP-N-acetylglucosamine 1-carboxyvinyltransferase n=1 Tax=Alkalispirochaeta sphaeroplastigenens TaxID=1187066 RepID=A0A2S4JHK2_9SPIO|nr:UDP-N-acetylglucosamine 1-carboxyvinyltransferase [Alkalispirochaeta sphaeroplastigenens]POQ99022.1 UDP-N-acetylglucosamine 1-carboxyvinyltransferase [Alkalispirochaeta sphaeroplastigenens]